MTLYDERGAAQFLNCSKALLRRMRREKRGPRWTRIGKLVRYPAHWLADYIEAHANETEKPLNGIERIQQQGLPSLGREKAQRSDSGIQEG